MSTEQQMLAVAVLFGLNINVELTNKTYVYWQFGLPILVPRYRGKMNDRFR